MKSKLPLMVIPLICLVILIDILGNPLAGAHPPNLHPGLEVITAGNVNRLEEIARYGKGTVYGIALSPDGSIIAVSTATGIFFYDRQTLTQVNYLEIGLGEDSDDPYDCAGYWDNLDFSPDGQRLAVGDDDSILMWDVHTEKVGRQIYPRSDAPASYIREVQFSTDGSRLLVSRAEKGEYPCITPGRFEILDAITGSLIAQVPFDVKAGSDGGYYYDIRPGQQGNVFFNTEEKWVEMAVNSGKVLRAYALNDPAIPRSAVVIEPFQDAPWKIYRPEDQSCIFSVNEISYPYLWNRWLLDFTPDGAVAITLRRAREADLQVWDFGTCTAPEKALFFPTAGRKIAFSPRGTYLITGSAGWHQYLWRTTDGMPLFAYKAEDFMFGPDEGEAYVLLGSYLDDYVEVVNINSGEVLFKHRNDSSWNIGRRMHISPDGNFLLVNEHLIDIKRHGTDERTLPEDSYYFFSQDSARIAQVFTEGEDIILNFYETDTGNILPTLTQRINFGADIFRSFAYASSFSPGWHYFATAAAIANEQGVYEQKVIIQDLTTQQVSTTLQGAFLIRQPVFSPDETLIFTEKADFPDHFIQVWETTSGALLYEFLSPMGTMSGQDYALSPDGKALAFIAEDGTIRIWGVKARSK